MKTLHTAILVSSLSLLAACTSVDTTGISPESSKTAKGPSAALVTLTEYGDLQCPACKSAHTTLNKPLLEQFGDKIRFEFRHFPLRSIHPYAYKAAMASECAADQGKFWEFLDLNYEKQNDLKNAPYAEWAATLGLDADLFNRCLTSEIKGDAVSADLAEGTRLKVNSTPSYFVNGVAVKTNTLEEIATLIQSSMKISDSAPL
jgi:protein-disulfide isomerase